MLIDYGSVFGWSARSDMITLNASFHSFELWVDFPSSKDWWSHSSSGNFGCLDCLEESFESSGLAGVGAPVYFPGKAAESDQQHQVGLLELGRRDFHNLGNFFQAVSWYLAQVCCIAPQSQIWGSVSGWVAGGLQVGGQLELSSMGKESWRVVTLPLTPRHLSQRVGHSETPLAPSGRPWL